MEFNGIVGINKDDSYRIELRHLVAAKDDPSQFEVFFNPPDITAIICNTESGKTTLRYSVEDIGSEVTITKISSVNRKYTMFAKLLLRITNGQSISSSEMKKVMQYCLDTGVLGYNLLNDELEGDSDIPATLRFDEKKEQTTLKSIMNKREQDLKDLEYCITEQMKFVIYMWETVIDISSQDANTVASFIEENEWLNEYGYRMLGNTIIPFTVLFSDEVLTDLNDDGLLNGEYTTESEQIMMLSTGNAGITTRAYADLCAVMFPIMTSFDGDMSKMSPMEQLKYNELMEIAGIGTNVNRMFSVPGYSWYATYSIYTSQKMDTMYKLMYDNGITINMAGLKIGWNSIISEWYESQIGSRFLPVYDFTKDTDAIKRQGVNGIISQLNTYINSTK